MFDLHYEAKATDVVVMLIWVKFSVHAYQLFVIAELNYPLPVALLIERIEIVDIIAIEIQEANAPDFTERWKKYIGIKAAEGWLLRLLLCSTDCSYALLIIEDDGLRVADVA